MGDYLSQDEIEKLLRKITDDEDKGGDAAASNNFCGQKTGNNTRNEGLVVEKAKFKPLKKGAVDSFQRDIKEYGDILLNLSVELGKTSLTVREVLNMKKDSLIKLEKMAGDNVEVLVNKKYFAGGEIVVINENFGLRIISF